MKIVSRWDATRVLYEGEHETMKEAVEQAYLRGADLDGADLHGAYLRGADLHGAYLRGADLDGADLHGAYLRGADLHGAYLRGADLHGADLRGADLDGADLHGAYLRGATVMPDGETWERYLTETVPALLTAGGMPLESFRESWECHSWTNCPMAHAFQTHDLSGVPVLLRPRANEFIQFFDAGLIPWSAIEAALAGAPTDEEKRA